MVCALFNPNSVTYVQYCMLCVHLSEHFEKVTCGNSTCVYAIIL